VAPKKAALRTSKSVNVSSVPAGIGSTPEYCATAVAARLRYETSIGYSEDANLAIAEKSSGGEAPPGFTGRSVS
jgi:hypothetical protein